MSRWILSDFYARIYHHRLENALQSATAKRDLAKRIMVLLNKLAARVSYGLPVGGNASRLLAELVLDKIDRLLSRRKIQFCRFVDDYYLFAGSEQDARKALVLLSDLLLTNEGLTLQRSKTRIMTAEEFVRSSPLRNSGDEDSEHEQKATEFLRLRLTYDPYSPTADDDYDELKLKLAKHDVVGMLARELRKSRVDEALVRQLIKSIRHLAPHLRDPAVRSLLGSIEVLYPLFPTVALTVAGLVNDLSSDLQEIVFATIRELLSKESYVTMVPANLCFAVRVLAHDSSSQTAELLVQLLSDNPASKMLRRDLVLCLAKHRHGEELSNLLKTQPEGPWGRRAQAVTSFSLNDEGRHWRKQTKKTLHDVDRAFLDWLGNSQSPVRAA